MPLGAMLDVALGLMFVYLLLALFGAAAQEVAANVLKLRSQKLYDGIWRMLSTADRGDGKQVSPRELPSPPDAAAAAPAAPAFATADAFFKAVWGHELIKGLSQDSQGPSYIPSRAFCAALVDVLRSGSQAAPVVGIEQSIAALPAGAAKQALSALFAEAGGDLDRFKAGVSAWFDDAMDRVSGSYKRWVQGFTFAFGLLAAVVLNISTLDVAATLWRDPVAREAVAAQAVEWGRLHPNPSAAGPAPGAPDGANGVAAASPGKAASAIVQEARTLPLPIGWDSDVLKTLFGDPGAGGFNPFWHLVLLILGWVMTAFAVALGAPFWFDALQRVISLRSAGPKPATSSTAS